MSGKISVVVPAFAEALPLLIAAEVARAAGVEVEVTEGTAASPFAETFTQLIEAAATTSNLSKLSLTPAGVPAEEAAYFKTLGLVHLVPAARAIDIIVALNAHLATRAALAGSVFTGLDVAVAAVLLGNRRAAIAISAANAGTIYTHVVRWIASLTAKPTVAVTDAVLGIAQAAFVAGQKAFNDAHASRRAVRTQLAAQGSFDIDLPNAVEGKVVTRFPPEPSGYLHIGHVKALILNHYFAERFKGKMLLRFDDTNPSKEKDEYVDNIMKDMATLGVTWEGPTYTSDLMETFYEYGRKLIREGNAYADNTPVDRMREERGEGIESECRKTNTVEKNLEIFEAMIAGKEFTYAIRARLNMQDPVGCMRDPTLFRSNTTPHHRQGTKYTCYPTYDFACPIIDSLEGVTHTLRTIEYHDRNAQYYWICDACGLRRPDIWDFSRLNFQYTLLSKRKLQSFVDRGLVEGWFDPRFPTVQGILRRGLRVDTLREFMVSQGASKNITLMEWEKLWALNKAKLEPTAPRYNAVDAATRVPLELSDLSEPETVTAPLHNKNAEVGTKQTVRSRVVYLEGADAATVKEGEEVTLLSWGNVLINKIECDAGGNVIALKGQTNLSGNVQATALKAHWVGFAAEEELVPLKLVEYGHLISAPKLDEDTDVDKIINRNSKMETKALGEAALRVLKVNDSIQLQRKGFYRVDKAPTAENPDQEYVLILIPDGKSKSIKTC